MKILSKILGDPNEKVIKSLEPLVAEVNALEKKYEKMSDDELKAATYDFRKRIGVKNVGVDSPEDIGRMQVELDKILPEAFAVVREASKRVLGQRHYDVQLIGGIVLHRGQIAEMRTGEGKTLVATLPLYLNALTGWGAQLITVNDYLSRVGAGWMAPIFHFLGLTIGVIVHDSALTYDPLFDDDSQFDERLKHFRPVSRGEAYNCDIVYGTNNEFGFDYLRDNMVASKDQMVQRKHYFTIVDEVDSILIDEARTPLIISAPAEEATDKYQKFSQLVERLKEDEDYNIDEKMKAATLTEAGISKMEKWLGLDNIYTTGGVREVHHIEQALKARVLFSRDKDYVVKDGQIIIVDEFTGRLLHGRRYSEGLHQAIEAKEGVKIQRESQTLATVTFQNYFRMYQKLAGMTGTAATEAEEFARIYGLETVVIPTNKPMIRKDLNDLIYKTEDGKFKAVIEEVKKRNKAGQPILIGTISIEKNEVLADLMDREGLKVEYLNAKNHEKEAKIIAQAGRKGAITLATNMAGRGVDIVLGGREPGRDDPGYADWKKKHNKVIELGGLHVIGTERHESRRIDNQLRGRAGRQGDSGSSLFYVSTEDDLMRIFGGDRMKSIMTTLRVPEDMPIENKIISRSIESAQKKVEGNNFDIRKHLVEYDDILNKHRETIYRRRREILEIAESQAKESKESNKSLSQIILEMTNQEIEQVVSFHTAAENIGDWNLKEIYQVVSTIFPVEEKLKTDLTQFIQEGNKLDKAKARTEIIEHLEKLSIKNYEKIQERANESGLDWPAIEKEILIRSIDALWVEHLEVMTSLRQGIGLRGYGQRDPLVEYKKESYGLFNELNNLIQRQVVYSIFKVGQVEQFNAPTLSERASNFSAPAKEMEKGSSSIVQAVKSEAKDKSDKPHGPAQKMRDDKGKKIGRNDPCPCGSGKKYKKCHGR